MTTAYLFKTTASRELYIRANTGDIYSQVKLASYYEKGKYGFEKDFTKALLYYKKAAAKGNAFAQYRLALFYKDTRFHPGMDEPIALQESIRLFEAAAKKGVSGAQLELGAHFFSGEGVSQNREKAIKLFKKAADKGDSDAQNSLGDCYYYGEGVPQDLNKAIRLFKKAAKAGHESAQYSLGYCYYYGEGVPQDFTKAVELFKKAADQGNSDAQNSLGECYYYGQDVPQDFTKAVELFKKSADQGNSDAQNNLKRLIVFPIEEKEREEKAEDNRESSIKRKREENDDDEEEIFIKLKKNKSLLIDDENDERSSSIEPLNEPIRGVVSMASALSSLPLPNLSKVITVKPVPIGSSGSAFFSSPAFPKQVQKNTPIVPILQKKSFSSNPITHQTFVPGDEILEVTLPPPQIKPIISRSGLKNSGEKVEQQSPSHSLREFKPKVKPDQIALSLTYSPARFFTAANRAPKKKENIFTGQTVSSPYKHHSPSLPKTQLSEKAKCDIGRWGEIYVFEMLKQRYKEEYPNTTIQDTQQGFKLMGKNTKDENFEIEVTWYNKEEEKGLPIDLTLTTRTTSNELIETKYIEVKTTEADQINTAYFSENEMQAMLQLQGHYSIFRVFNAGKEDPSPRIEEISNPWEKIKGEALSITSIGLRI